MASDSSDLSVSISHHPHKHFFAVLKLDISGEQGTDQLMLHKAGISGCLVRNLVGFLGPREIPQGPSGLSEDTRPGNDCYIAVENGYFDFDVDLPSYKMIIFHSYVAVYQRVNVGFLFKFRYSLRRCESTNMLVLQSDGNHSCDVTLHNEVLYQRWLLGTWGCSWDYFCGYGFFYHGIGS
jgi:hypothetical protein